MSSYLVDSAFPDPAFLQALQQEGLVTATFVRLDPARRAAVVAAILEEAALKGPSQINIKEVARRAGVSIGSLYQYFHHRQGLFDFSAELITRRMISLFAEYQPYLTALPLSEALRAYLQGGEQMPVEFQGYIHYFTRAAYAGEPGLEERVVKPVAAAMLAMTVAILQAARERGEISQEIDFEASARLINTLIIAVYDSRVLPHLNTYYQLGSAEITDARILDCLLDLVRRALQP